jgi:hypothetical protein
VGFKGNGYTLMNEKSELGLNTFGTLKRCILFVVALLWWSNGCFHDSNTFEFSWSL